MITVIIPLYNKKSSIARALDSVLSQTYQDFEVIVVDDGSTDEGAAIVEQYTDPRIRLVRQENLGVSAARNRGIKEAKGDYVAFLDADDEWMTEFLEEIVALQNEFPQCRAHATNYKFCREGIFFKSVIRRITFTETHGMLTNYFDVAAHSHPPITSNSISVERQLLLEIGGFPRGVTSGEDLLTWARIATQTSISYSHKVLAIYNLGEGYDKRNLPARRNDKKDVVGDGLLEILYDSPSTKGLKKYLSHWHKMRASVAVRYGERKETIYESKQALKYNPFNFSVMLFVVLAILPASIRKFIICKFN